MQDLTAEGIDHAYCSVAYRTHGGLIKAAAFDQFTNQHALIDQGNVEITGNEATIAILHLAWVGNDTLKALRLEVLCKQHKLTVTGHFAPVKDGNTRRFAAARPLPVGVYQGVEYAVAGW